jgi:hypothetical protein
VTTVPTPSVPPIVGRRPRRPTSPLRSFRALTYLARGPGTVILNGGESNDRLVDWTSSLTMTGGPGNAGGAGRSSSAVRKSRWWPGRRRRFG